jgi:signal transduction histidine kinase
LNLAGQRERQHLATELHDYLAQLLALSRIRLAQAKQQPMTTALGKILSELQDVMDQALTYTRTLVAQLSPPILKEFGLPMALKWLAEQMIQRDLKVSLELGTEHLALPEDQAMLLFQSVRELLMNIVKHASAEQARITVKEEEGWLSITVADQGRGFSPSDSIQAAGSTGIPGFGLFSIRERMLALGGRFELRSQPGRGTEATLTAPLTPGKGAGQTTGRQWTGRSQACARHYNTKHGGGRAEGPVGKLETCRASHPRVDRRRPCHGATGSCADCWPPMGISRSWERQPMVKRPSP